MTYTTQCLLQFLLLFTQVASSERHSFTGILIRTELYPDIISQYLAFEDNCELEFFLMNLLRTVNYYYRIQILKADYVNMCKFSTHLSTDITSCTEDLDFEKNSTSVASVRPLFLLLYIKLSVATMRERQLHLFS